MNPYELIKYTYHNYLNIIDTDPTKTIKFNCLDNKTKLIYIDYRLKLKPESYPHLVKLDLIKLETRWTNGWLKKNLSKGNISAIIAHKMFQEDKK